MQASGGNKDPVILNITNGGSAADIMLQAGIAGEILPWKDVLHDGPVPYESLRELSKTRADFIHRCGWGASEEEVLQDFRERDETLLTWEFYDRIVLWFEHDLYDQLQIIQLLDFFHHQPEALERLWLINPDRYLGMLTPEQMKALLEEARPVTSEQLRLANRAWSAFRKPTPEMLHRLLLEDLDALPWLHLAIIRLFEEYPACHNGLSRTARQLLEIAATGETRIDRIFEASQQQELARFMGDASFEQIIRQMLRGEAPLLKNRGEPVTCPFNPRQKLHLTETGRAVLDGEINWLDLQPIDRWIGGVHLTAENLWCYDAGHHHIKRITLG